MENKTSGLRPVLDSIYTAPNLEVAIGILDTYLKEPTCVIRASERAMMLIKAKQCDTLLRFQQYMTNSFLRYEGMSMNRPKYR